MHNRSAGCLMPLDSFVLSLSKDGLVSACAGTTSYAKVSGGGNPVGLGARAYDRMIWNRREYCFPQELSYTVALPSFPQLSRHSSSSPVIPAEAGIQWWWARAYDRMIWNRYELGLRPRQREPGHTDLDPIPKNPQWLQGSCRDGIKGPHEPNPTTELNEAVHSRIEQGDDTYGNHAGRILRR